MGEATFYLKAVFKDEETAKAVFEQFKPLLEDLVEAYEFWQRNRGKMPVRKLVKILSQRPSWVLVRNKAKVIEEDDKWLNFLAGELEMAPDFQLELEGNQILLSCYVWHLATWDGIADWLRMQGGKAGWVSDEWFRDPSSTDYFEAIEPTSLNEELIGRC